MKSGMIYIGCHLSVTDGYEAMGYTMSRFGGNTFAWFTRNPRGGRTKPVVQEDMDALFIHLKRERFGSLVAHYRRSGISIRRIQRCFTITPQSISQPRGRFAWKMQ
jgi:hypothetical protein